MTPSHVLVLTGGHPFDHAAFFEMVDALPGLTWEEAAHPDAIERLRPETVNADVVLAYDMPGVIFHEGRLPSLPEPPHRLVDGMHRLLAVGQPFVFLHHAIASWPAWPGFAEIIGGRFHEAPGRLRDRDWPDSGWRPDVRQTLTVVAPAHPVCAGLPESFEIWDETYQCPVFDDEVEPLLVTDAPRGDDFHYSAARAILGHIGDRTGWNHPPGSRLAAWVRRVGRSSVVYIQPGDGPSVLARGPSVFRNPHYRRLLANAIHWAAAGSGQLKEHVQ